MSRSPSLREVAHHAGVSLGTASRALNNKSNVLPVTRARVVKAATELGYKIQFRAATPVSTKINTIGLVMKRDPGIHPRVDPFNYTILTGIEDECRNLGLNLMFTSVEVDENSHAISEPMLIDEEKVDGLVIVGAVLSNSHIVKSLNNDIPIVLIDAYCPLVDFDTVRADNYNGAYNAVCYLIDKGHTKIGLLGSSGAENEHNSVRVRRIAYHRALKDRGINERYIVDSRLNNESAYQATLELMDTYPEITAIFSCNDEIAFAIYQALEELGLSVPDDISIMGFDDTEIASLLNPPLSTILVDKFLMGVLGVRQLYDRATHMERVAIETVLRTQIIERDSIKQLDDRSAQSVLDKRTVPDTWR